MQVLKTTARRLLCAALMALLLAALLPTAALAAKAEAAATTMRVAGTTGTVTVKNAGGQIKSVFNNMSLYDGWTVETGAASYATLSLDSAKAIKLNANTKVELRQNTVSKKLELFVSKGSLAFDVDKLASDETMNIRTANMVCGIRGTMGEVTAVSAEVTETFLLLGETVIINTAELFEALAEGGAAAADASNRNLSTLLSNPGHLRVPEELGKINGLVVIGGEAPGGESILADRLVPIKAGERAVVRTGSGAGSGEVESTLAASQPTTTILTLHTEDVAGYLREWLLTGTDTGKALQIRDATGGSVDLTNDTPEAAQKQTKADEAGAAAGEQACLEVYRAYLDAGGGAPVGDGRDRSRRNAWAREGASGMLNLRDLMAVSFDSAGGTAVAAQLVQSGHRASVPEAPTRSGYTFDHWEYNGAAFDFATPITKHMTLTAVWKQETYAIRVSATERGTPTAAVGGKAVTAAAAGETVTLSLRMVGVEGYYGLQVKDAAGKAVATQEKTVTTSREENTSVCTYSCVFTMPAADVTVTDAALYAISFDDDGVENCLVSGSVALDAAKYSYDNPYSDYVEYYAAAGETVTVTLDGVHLTDDGIAVYWYDDEEQMQTVDCTETESGCTFVMPGHNVWVDMTPKVTLTLGGDLKGNPAVKLYILDEEFDYEVEPTAPNVYTLGVNDEYKLVVTGSKKSGSEGVMECIDGFTIRQVGKAASETFGGIRGSSEGGLLEISLEFSRPTRDLTITGANRSYYPAKLMIADGQDNGADIRCTMTSGEVSASADDDSFNEMPERNYGGTVYAAQGETVTVDFYIPAEENNDETWTYYACEYLNENVRPAGLTVQGTRCDYEAYPEIVDTYSFTMLGEGVEFTVRRTKCWKVEIDNSLASSVSVSKVGALDWTGDMPAYALPEETVTLTVASGADAIGWQTAEGTWTLQPDNGVWSFSMPSEDVRLAKLCTITGLSVQGATVSLQRRNGANVTITNGSATVNANDILRLTVMPEAVAGDAVPRYVQATLGAIPGQYRVVQKTVDNANRYAYETFFDFTTTHDLELHAEAPVQGYVMTFTCDEEVCTEFAVWSDGAFSVDGEAVPDKIYTLPDPKVLFGPTETGSYTGWSRGDDVGVTSVDLGALSAAAVFSSPLNYLCGVAV